MQRPSMDPMFFDETPVLPSKRRIDPRRLIQVVWRIGRILLIRPFASRRNDLVIDNLSPLNRFLRGLLYRLLFVPILLMLIIAALVFVGTHPPRVPINLDPVSLGVYYDPVNFLSQDGTPLEGWLIPAVDARDILQNGEEAVRRQHGAVILVHDFGSSRQQMLPLIKPLHESGLVVFVIELRGGGGRSRAGQTFGINEARDIQAAAEMLRRRSYIDDKRIAVVGVGSGANAALLAAQRDPAIGSLVLHHPIQTIEQAVAAHVAPARPWLRWMRPLCKWTLEIGYQLDADEINLSQLSRTISSRPVLMLDGKDVNQAVLRPADINQTIAFLRQHLL